MPAEIDDFLAVFEKSLVAKTFVKMTLGNYKGTTESLQKVFVRPIETRKGLRSQFQYRYNSRETVENFSFDEAAAKTRELLASGFRSGYLFTLERDLQLEIGKKKNRLTEIKPSFSEAPSLTHNREKHYYISPEAPYLKALGISNESGKVKADRQDKWRQINKFVDIIAGLIDNSPLAVRESLRIADMGCGKGYLTFAVYDYLTNVRGLKITMTGVDTKPEIVSFCGELAASCGFGGLDFECGTIAEYEPGSIDILIALHACDTATDDALFKGIKANATLLVTAPCCHKEIRRQITSPPIVKNVLKHGTLMERTAEIVTDGLRSLLLEQSGYSTKVFEFISAEHTPKNNMIVATRLSRCGNTDEATREIAFLKIAFGIEHQRLESLLAPVRT